MAAYSWTHSPSQLAHTITRSSALRRFIKVNRAHGCPRARARGGALALWKCCKSVLPRCMECRRGLAMRILSVRPSVCQTRDL